MTLQEIINSIKQTDFNVGFDPGFLQQCKDMSRKGMLDYNAIRKQISPALYTAFDVALCSLSNPDAAADAELFRHTKHLTTTENGIITPVKDQKEVPRLQAISAYDLDKKDIPPIEWIVNGILPTGLAMLGAPSKYFKSYFALDLCISVCNAAAFLGKETSKHTCIYFDLESTDRRPQMRLRQILGDADKPQNLEIITGLQPVQLIGQGLEKQIALIMADFPDTKLIVIDVLQKIRPAAKRTQSGYDRDYSDFSALKKIADTFDICLLLVHHTRKMKDPYDIYNELSGSVGVMGALDAALVISKEKRDDEEATLHIIGRDMEEQAYQIMFDKSLMRWQCLGSAEDIAADRFEQTYQNSNIIKTIKKLLSQSASGTWECSAQELIEASKYFPGCQIYEDSGRVGKAIRDFENRLLLDGVHYSFRKTNRCNLYSFTSTNVTTSTASTNVTTSTDME